MNDDALLLRYVQGHADDAFTELVHRHLDLVYSTALRQTGGDVHRARDVAQRVFTLLARKAATLARHPALAGWLYTTAVLTGREVVRAEARRVHRDQHAYAMTEASSDSVPAAAWDRVRPVLDDALRDLDERDRTAVVLRYLENRPYADIGAALQINPNAVRMRVDRAMVKLRTALARRGVNSTEAALSAALTVPAAIAAPLGLAPQVAAAALAAAGAAAGVGTSLFTVFTAMTSTQLVVASTAALLALGTVVYQQQQLADSRSEVAALQRQAQDLQSRIQTLDTMRLAEQLAGNWNGVAAAASAPVGRAAADSIAPPAAPVTRDQVEARRRRAGELAQAGQAAEALQEYLWCYDTGMRQVAGYFIIRYSELLDEIAMLGRTYPPAFEALRQRRDAAEERLRLSTTDMEAGKDFGQINRILGENDRNIAFFEALDPDDVRRQHLVETSFARLMAERRYDELAKAMPYEATPKVWEEMVQLERCPAPSEAAGAQRRRQIIKWAARQVELQAGAGNVINANDMLERVLVFNDSKETVALLNQHLIRAGRPDLVISP
jgi:RNA polymerase sigma factor (sigma-70 family)